MRWKLPAGIRPVDKKTPRKLRADAARNRERVLEAAKAVFSAGGPEASLEAGARAAGAAPAPRPLQFPQGGRRFGRMLPREVGQNGRFRVQTLGRDTAG